MAQTPNNQISVGAMPSDMLTNMLLNADAATVLQVSRPHAETVPCNLFPWQPQRCSRALQLRRRTTTNVLSQEQMYVVAVVIM